jgi:hypothetical protein
MTTAAPPRAPARSTSAAALLKSAGPDTPGELRVLPLSQLVESPWNPRK